jgi:SAM-dependent methyltransferase
LKPGNSFDFSAELYDLLYKDKNYEREADFVEEVFLAFGKPNSILEVGCGTGNYTQILRQRGYDISGLDISEKMIKAARRKCDCVFQVGDIRRFSLGRKFDACVALFAVMGYMVENSDVMDALRSIRAHLKPGGLFVFDVWNGLAVLRILPEVRVKEVENAEYTVRRIANPTLKSSNHLCVVDYNYSVLNKKTQIFQESSESHHVRFYFPQEISFFLEQAGFEVLKICPFLDFSGVVDETVWNMAVVARAI